VFICEKKVYPNLYVLKKFFPLGINFSSIQYSYDYIKHRLNNQCFNLSLTNRKGISKIKIMLRQEALVTFL